MKKAGKDKASAVLITNIDAHTKGGDSNDKYYCSKGDHTMKHVMFIILGAVTVMCLALGNWLPPALAVEVASKGRPNATTLAGAQTMRQIPLPWPVSKRPQGTRQAGA